MLYVIPNDALLDILEAVREKIYVFYRKNGFLYARKIGNEYAVSYNPTSLENPLRGHLNVWYLEKGHKNFRAATGKIRVGE